MEEGDRHGPVTRDDISQMISDGVLGPDSYVWVKGMENWRQVKEIEELGASSGSSAKLSDDSSNGNLDVSHDTGTGSVRENERTERDQTDSSVKITGPGSDNTNDPAAQSIEHPGTQTGINVGEATTLLSSLDSSNRNLYIKTGLDRGERTREYGPFNLEMVVELYREKRINGKTLIYFPGLNVWRILASFQDFEKVFEELPPIIADEEKRLWERKPFTARIFFTSEDKFFEALCQDISLGGMRILLDGFPGKNGDEISMNVHPEREEHRFVAKAKIVRIDEQGSGFSLNFVDLTDQAKSAIISYLASR